MLFLSTLQTQQRSGQKVRRARKKQIFKALFRLSFGIAT
jgi:hypothetical protein